MRNTISWAVKAAAGSAWRGIRRIYRRLTSKSPSEPLDDSEQDSTQVSSEHEQNELHSLYIQRQRLIQQPMVNPQRLKEITQKIAKLIARDFGLRPLLKSFNYGLSATLMLNIVSVITYLRESDNVNLTIANNIIIGNFVGWLADVIMLYVNNARSARNNTNNCCESLLTELKQEFIVSLEFINACYSMGAGVTTISRLSKPTVLWACTVLNTIVAPRIFIRYKGYGGHQPPLIISGDSRKVILGSYSADAADTILTYAGTTYNLLRGIPDLISASPQFAARINPYAFWSSTALALISTGLSIVEIISLKAQSNPKRAIARVNTMFEMLLAFGISYGQATQMIVFAILAGKQTEDDSFSLLEYISVFGISAMLSLPYVALAQQQQKNNREKAQGTLQMRRGDLAVPPQTNWEVVTATFFRKGSRHEPLRLDQLPRLTSEAVGSAL
jgi:hypothetical protein